MIILSRPALLAPVMITALALAAVAGCGTSGAPGAPATAIASGAPATTSAAPSVTATLASGGPSGASAAQCDSGPWRSVSITVTHQVTVPPVPVITAVRAAAHAECGYDRLVLDITGPVPGYAIRYADHVTADPSGAAIMIPGRRYLLITLKPAQAHTGPGAPSIPRQPQATGYPALAGWALAGDFEGVVTVGIGLQHSTVIRVGELPGRLYIDIRN
jgi:hypothetical protein